MITTANDSSLWDQLYQTAAYPHYLQSPIWHQQPGQIKILLVDSQGRPTAGSIFTRIPILRGKWAYYEAVRGPLFTTPESLTLHLQQLKTALPKDAIGVHVSPYLYQNDTHASAVSDILAGQGFLPVSSARNSLYTSTPVVNLSPGIESIRANYRSSFKRQLNKSKKIGIEIVTDSSPAYMADYIHGHTRANLARGAPPPSRTILQGWHQLLRQAPGQLRLSLAKYQGQVIAGQISIICGNRMIYEWGFSDSADQYKSLAKSHILHDAAINYAVNRNLTSYDLGGFWKAQGASNSLNRFKLAITDNIEDVLPKHEYLIKPVIHNLYLLLRKLINKTKLAKTG